MPRFRYTATDSNDRLLPEGTIEAENRYVAVARLLQDGLHVVEIKEISESEAGTNEPGEAKPVELALEAESAWLTEDRRIAVVDGMADVVRSGLPLAAGLRALGSELPSRRGRRALVTISKRLERGVSLDDAVAGQLDIVPSHLRVLLRAGLNTGRLGELLEHYLHYARTSLDTRRRSILALFYPMLLILVTVMVVGAMIAFVVPPFEDIFKDFGMELPDLTLAVLWLSKAIGGWRLAILPVLLLTIVFAWVLAGRIAGPLQRQWLYHVPALGRMIRLSAISRFCHLLAIGLDHRLPLTEALLLAGKGTDDAYIGRSTQRMAGELSHGHSLGHAASKHRMTPEIAHVFEWEGHDDSFCDVLRATGDICAAQARVQSGLIRILIEPLAVFGVAVAVGVVAIALLMPMFNLLSALS
ncbi:MAG: type II secretion system F family protein [Planctomycetaceae bacterium]